jgi:hypothetical protein
MVTSSRMGSAPPEREHNKPKAANCGPMMQQGTMGAHGYDMHPQGFLRLIGCHESSRQKEEDVAVNLRA